MFYTTIVLNVPLKAYVEVKHDQDTILKTTYEKVLECKNASVSWTCDTAKDFDVKSNTLRR